jgi:hypothetical protein
MEGMRPVIIWWISYTNITVGNKWEEKTNEEYTQMRTEKQWIQTEYSGYNKVTIIWNIFVCDK